jgi:hypothetical protein
MDSDTSLAMYAGHQPSRRAIVAEAADGQSADGFDSLQLPLLSSRPALRPGNDTTVTGVPAPPSPRWNHTHQAIRRDGTDGVWATIRPPDQASYPTQAVQYRRRATANPMRGRSSAGFSPTQARGLGSLLRREILSPVGMLPGLGSQRATLISELPVHTRDFLLGLGHCLRRPGDLLPQRLALRLRLLGSLEPIGAVGVTVRHDRTDTPPDQSYPRTGWVTGATSGPHPLRASGTTAVTSGQSTPPLSSSLRSAPQVLGPPPVLPRMEEVAWKSIRSWPVRAQYRAHPGLRSRASGTPTRRPRSKMPSGADAGQATCSCSGGHPQAPAGSVADTSRPDTSPSDTDLVDTDRGSGSSSGQPRRPRCPVLQPPRHRPRCPAAAGRRRTRSRRCGAAAGPRRLDLLVCAGHVVRSTQPAENGCPNAWTPDAACRTSGAGTPRHCGHPRPPQGTGTLRQRPRWTAGSRTVHHPATVSDRNGTPMCSTGHHARLTARSVVWGRP